MNYKSQYNKYKKKYLKLKTNYKKKLFQMGGNFQFDEEDIYAHRNINDMLDRQIDELKYISGPVKMTILCGPSNKIIYLIGDMHIYTNKGFMCGPNDEKHTLYFPEYMLRLIKKNSSDQFDIFTELQYHHTKRGSIIRKGMIQNINELFNFCFTNLYDKEKCQTFFPNARFHAMDIRQYAHELGEGSDYIKVFTSFRNIIDKFREELLLRLGLLESLVSIIQLTDEYKTQINITGQRLIANILILIKDTPPPKNSIKISAWIYDLIKEIDNDTVREFNDNYIELSKLLTKKLEPEYINFIKEFMGDENGLYDNIDQRFWELIGRSDKLNRNFLSLNPKDREYVKLYYSKLIRESVEKYKKDIDPIIKDVLTKGDINFSDPSINKLSYLLFDFAVMIMDIYILGRLFKEYVQNSIIITGLNHTNSYEDILKNIGYKVIFSKDIYTVDMHSMESGHPDLYSKRCIDVSDAQFIKEERLPSCIEKV